MSARTHAALTVWRARKATTGNDLAFLAYSMILLALVVVVPVARVVWVSATSPEGLALFTSPAAPGFTGLTVAVLWGGAMLLGRDRGPAILPPFLTHALAASSLPRAETFRHPLLRAGAVVTTVTTLIAGTIGASLVTHGQADPLSALVFTVAGAVVGVTTVMAWLAGQAFPRTAIPVALGVILLGAITSVFPATHPFAPWGWVGLSYPGSSTPLSLVALAALAATVVAVPTLMNRLSFAALTVQAARWDSATTHATGMELGSAATVYQRRPHIGRHLRAVHPRHRLTGTFLIRDLLGATRTPGRLIVGVLALAAAATLMAFAFAPDTPGWLFGAAAGLLMFAGLGPLTDGIRHAAHVAADFPLYGLSDERLLMNHALFPLALVVTVVPLVVIVCVLASGIAAGAPILSSVLLGLLALMVRIINALKRPLPPVLLTPMPTAAGDPMAAVRLAWGLDGILLAGFAGVAAALACEAPVLVLGVAVGLVGAGVNRWRHRG